MLHIKLLANPGFWLRIYILFNNDSDLAVNSLQLGVQYMFIGWIHWLISTDAGLESGVATVVHRD